MVARTFGRLPAPSAATTSSGTTMPAVFPPVLRMVVWSFISTSPAFVMRRTSPIREGAARLETEREHAIAGDDGRRPRPDRFADRYPAAALQGVVRAPWLGGQVASAGDGGEGQGGPPCAADRAHWRRQDAGGV